MPLREEKDEASAQAFGGLRLTPLVPEPPHRPSGVFVFGAGGVSEPPPRPEPPPVTMHVSGAPLHLTQKTSSRAFVFTAPSSCTRTPAQEEADFAARVRAAEVKDQLRNAEHQEIRNRLRDTLVRSGEWVALGPAAHRALTAPAAKQMPQERGRAPATRAALASRHDADDDQFDQLWEWVCQERARLGYANT